MILKILIIKLGYSETLVDEVGRIPSLGDVLRTTPILRALKEKYKDSHITWLVSEHAEPLLRGNKFIDKVLIWDDFVPFQLMKEKFDILMNLEKILGVAALSDMVDGWMRYGFRFDSIKGSYHAYERGLNCIEYLEKKSKSSNSKDYWQKILIEMFGVERKGQEYIIGYEPNTTEIHDIGLNYNVGSKWPTKGMSIEKWKEIEKGLIDLGFTVSWQEGLKDYNGLGKFLQADNND